MGSGEKAGRGAEELNRGESSGDDISIEGQGI